MNEKLMNEIELFGACMARDGAAYVAGAILINPIDKIKCNKHYIEIVRLLNEQSAIAKT